MATTNYVSTFIQVADDCPVTEAEVPRARTDKATVASLQYDLLAARPYELTSDDLLFEVHANRQGVADPDREQARNAFFAKSQACLRASPLGKRYGWGLHHDEHGRVALVGLGTEEYARLAKDDTLKQLKAMRSKRA